MWCVTSLRFYKTFCDVLPNLDSSPFQNVHVPFIGYYYNVYVNQISTDILCFYDDIYGNEQVEKIVIYVLRELSCTLYGWHFICWIRKIRRIGRVLWWCV